MHRIRDLNDEINKLIREKGHWERRIVELGGPDYSKATPKVTDSQGRDVAELTGGCRARARRSIAGPLNRSSSAHQWPCGPIAAWLTPGPPPHTHTAGKGRGYRYFGAAKALPGVKELFEREAPKVVRRTRHQMYKSIDPDYYGFRDEEDGVLERVEAEAEHLIRAEVRGRS